MRWGSSFSATVVLVSALDMARAEPLNTGYNHSVSPPTLYLIGQADDYWIKIASYEPPATSVPVAPARVITPAGWALVPGARWIGPRPSSSSSTATSPANPAYSIYRKCFCLLQGFANAQLSFQIRGDDNVHVWLNTVTNQLLAPVAGNSFPPSQAHPRTTVNQGHFRAGRNCLYVLVEDTIGIQPTYLGHTGFSLAGTVTAAGLMPGMAAGVEASFGPCGCPGEGTPPPGGAVAPAVSHDDSAVVQAIVQFAEARRVQLLARLSGPAAGNGVDGGH